METWLNYLARVPLWTVLPTHVQCVDIEMKEENLFPPILALAHNDPSTPTDDQENLSISGKFCFQITHHNKCTSFISQNVKSGQNSLKLKRSLPNTI